MIHNSEDIKKFGHRGVTLVSVEGLISMHVEVTRQHVNLPLGESWVIVECMLANIV